MSLTDTLPTHLASIIERRMSAPKTAVVIARVQQDDGTTADVEVFRAADEAEAARHIDNVISHKIGRSYINRATGRTVRYVSAHVERIA